MPEGCNPAARLAEFVSRCILRPSPDPSEPMDRVTVENHASGPEIVLRGRRGNAMDESLLDGLEAVFSAPAPGPLVLRSQGGTFCTGLDLIDAASRDRDGMRALMTAFHRALRAAFVYPRPVVVALEGHALAGGALLAFCADARIMARGRGRFGVHGVQLGVAYPDVVIEILRHQLDARARQALLYEGRLHDEASAHAKGWIDEIVDPASLVARAHEIARSLDGPAFDATKSRLRAPAAEALATIDSDGMERWLDRWFAPDTTAKREQALRALRDRQGHRPGEDPKHHDRPTEDER